MFPEKVIEIMNSGKSVLYAWRKYRGYSQAKMARLLGINQSAYAQLEKVGRTFREETRQKLADILEIEPDDLFTEF